MTLGLASGMTLDGFAPDSGREVRRVLDAAKIKATLRALQRHGFAPIKGRYTTCLFVDRVYYAYDCVGLLARDATHAKGTLETIDAGYTSILLGASYDEWTAACARLDLWLYNVYNMTPCDRDALVAVNDSADDATRVDAVIRRANDLQREQLAERGEDGA